MVLLKKVQKSNDLSKNLHTAIVVLVSLSAFLCGQRLGAQQIAVHINALKYALVTPEAGVDMVVGGKTTAGVSVSGHWHPYGLDSRLMSVQPQFRYWFSGRPFNREYIGVSALYSTYDMTLSSRVYKGSAGGLGLTAGYVMPLNKRCALEFSGGLSLIFYNQKRYGASDSFSGSYEGGDDWAISKGCDFLPSNLGVTFIYIIR